VCLYKKISYQYYIMACLTASTEELRQDQLYNIVVCIATKIIKILKYQHKITLFLNLIEKKVSKLEFRSKYSHCSIFCLLSSVFGLRSPVFSFMNQSSHLPEIIKESGIRLCNTLGISYKDSSLRSKSCNSNCHRNTMIVV